MGGCFWSDEDVALLKRAGRVYADNEGVPQWRLAVACEPVLAERGYDACRVKAQTIMLDAAVREAGGGLRYDESPEAVYQQCKSITSAPGSRSTMPSLMVGEAVTDSPVVTDAGGDVTVHHVGRHLQTEQEVREYAGLAREQWECVYFKVNNYPQAAKGEEGSVIITELYQTDARFKPRPEYDALAEFRDAILRAIEQHAPTYPEYPDPPAADDPYMVEFCPFDLHLGKLAWAPETGGSDYDGEIAESLLMQATEDVLRKVRGFPVHLIRFPIGNDFFNADNIEGNTARGTPQDMDSRAGKIKDRAERLLIAVIDRLMTVAPVEVVVVPGNHDRDWADWIGRVLRAWYRNTDRVEVDCGPKLRKYKRWGVALIGYTHGNEEKHRDLPLIMARESGQDWAACEQFEFHVGHFHKSKETVYSAGDSFNGVRVRVLPSLSGTDAWHASQGYVKNWRAVESYLWSQRTGYVGHFSSNVTTRDGEQRIAA